MEAHQRRYLAILLADNQRNMLAHVVGRAEGDDFGVFAGGDGQARARSDGQAGGILPGGQIIR